MVNGEPLHKPRLSLSALRVKLSAVGPRWLYPLPLVPFVTEFVETGALPTSVRGWLTEVVAGIVIAVLILKVLRQHELVVAQARTDALTGLWNRLVFREAIEVECKRALRARQPLSLVFIDLDHFKATNHRHGR